MKDINKKMYSTYALNTHILVQLGQNIRKIREKKKIINQICKIKNILENYNWPEEIFMIKKMKITKTKLTNY